MKKVIAFILALVLSCSVTIPSYAGEFENVVFTMNNDVPIAISEQVITSRILEKSNDLVVKNNSSKFLKEISKFRQMDNMKLNEYIDNIIKKGRHTSIGVYEISSCSNYETVALFLSDIELKLMWLAAAEIAKNLGYPCAAKVVEYSVLGLPIDEKIGNGGLFHDKIVTTKIYKTIDYQIKTNGVQYDMIYDKLSFEKSDNSDLFYAIHKFNYVVTKHGYKKSLRIFDTFDFDYMKYDDLFTSAINNWGYLCQETGVLNSIEVNIRWNL